MTGANPVDQPPPRNPPNNSSAGGAYPGNNKPPMRNQPATQQPPPSSMGPASSPGPRRPAPPTPGYAAGGRGANGPVATSGPTGHMAAHAPQPMAPPQPMPPISQGGPTLFLIYNGQRYPVTKDQFIIGRGSKTSDLAIKDGNISRKHAAVIRRNGTFYIKDLGSTNGIDYKGMRIDNKRIDEGDVFHLCDYELRFTYRAD